MCILSFLYRRTVSTNHRIQTVMDAKMKEIKGKRENILNIMLSQCDNHWKLHWKDGNALIRFPVSFLRTEKLLLLIILCTAFDCLSAKYYMNRCICMVRARFIFFIFFIHSIKYKSNSQPLFDLIPLLKHFGHHSSVHI